jgi:REP element-mobilizing transposase RayT
VGRPLRNEIADGTYHVTSRGNNREQIVWDDHDRRLWLTRLGRVAHAMRWVVSGWCLLTNHYHLVVQIPFGGLSQGMQILNTGHSRAMARGHGRSRHLFQNRFYSGLIEEEAHLLATHRYVALNPVEAGLCGHPREWLWGSFRAAAGLESPPPFLAVGRILELFHLPPDDARAAYVSFVEADFPVSRATRR